MPPSPETSAALAAAFAERDITFIAGRRISAVDPARSVAALDDGTELPFDLFLGVPSTAPRGGDASGMTEDGYVPVDSPRSRRASPTFTRSATSRRPARRRPASSPRAPRAPSRRQLIAELRDGERPGPYDGRGSCYIEFGGGRVGRVDVDFLSGPTPTGTFNEPSAALGAEKEHFGSSRRARWFGA